MVDVNGCHVHPTRWGPPYRVFVGDHILVGITPCIYIDLFDFGLKPKKHHWRQDLASLLIHFCLSNLTVTHVHTSSNIM